MPNYILVIIFAILMLPGLVGVFLPVLPGVPYLFVIALIYGFIDRFSHLSWFNLLVLGLIAGASLLVDYFSGIIGAKYGGAGQKSMLFGFIGFTAGLLIYPPFGGLAGLFLGILIAELYFFKDHIKAIKAAGSGLIGVALGMVFNFLLALSILVLFLIFSLK